MITYAHFRKALKNLELQNENLKNLDAGTATLIREGVAESTIQRFEISCDMAWKLLKKFLVEELGISDVGNSPSSIFRHASENGLLRSSVEVWFSYVKARNATSHDYDGEKAGEVLALVDGFIDDAIGLYQTMTGEAWE